MLGAAREADSAAYERVEVAQLQKSKKDRGSTMGACVMPKLMMPTPGCKKCKFTLAQKAKKIAQCRARTDDHQMASA